MQVSKEIFKVLPMKLYKKQGLIHFSLLQFCVQVGTESEPFSSRAFITLHGHVRSKELPVYGTKMIGVRNGSLELHGMCTICSTHVKHIKLNKAICVFK